MNNIMKSYKNYRASGGGVEIDRLEYCRIISDFNKHLMNLVLEGNEVKLPERLGSIEVKGRIVVTKFDEELGRISNQQPDYGETNKLWARCPECKERKQMVYHENEHSNGARYKFFWSKERMLVDHKLFYTMVFTRTNKRAVSKLIKEGKEYYIEPTKY